MYITLRLIFPIILLIFCFVQYYSTILNKNLGLLLFLLRSCHPLFIHVLGEFKTHLRIVFNSKTFILMHIEMIKSFTATMYWKQRALNYSMLEIRVWSENVLVIRECLI